MAPCSKKTPILDWNAEEVVAAANVSLSVINFSDNIPMTYVCRISTATMVYNSYSCLAGLLCLVRPYFTRREKDKMMMIPV